MSRYIEIDGIRYRIVPQLVLEPVYGGEPKAKRVFVLEQIPFDSYALEVSND